MPILLQGYSTASTRPAGLLLRSTGHPSKPRIMRQLRYTTQFNLPPTLPGFGGDPNSAGVMAIRCPGAGRYPALADQECEAFLGPAMGRVVSGLQTPIDSFITTWL